MRGFAGLIVPGRRLALVGSVICLLLASCSETVAPPAATPTTTTSSAPPPPPITGPLEKDWKSYGGTAYFGCPEEFAVGKTALEDIHPKIFDPKSGQYVAPALPAIPAGETVTGAMCALSGSPDDMKVVYVVTTVKPGQAPTKTTGYAFDFETGKSTATKELQPPTPDLRLTEPTQWRLGATTSGAAWLNAFTDGHASASPPQTVLLSGADLSMAWNDPQPGRVWPDVLSFQRNTQPGNNSGAELRRPSGEAIYQDDEVVTVDAELSDGPDQLVKITRRDSPTAVSTMFFDLNSKSVIKVGDSDRISGGGLATTLSDGKLFVDGRDSADSQFGFGVWNLRTQHWDLLKNRDELRTCRSPRWRSSTTASTSRTSAEHTRCSRCPLPIRSRRIWSIRPFERISGWTLVCRGETTAGGECKEIVMVQDQDGHYPGPWF